MLKSSKLIKWLKSKAGCGYVYGANGQKCTISLLKELYNDYGSVLSTGYYQTDGNYTKSRCSRWIGKIVYDCSSLIKQGRKALSGIWVDVSADGTYHQCAKHGTIYTMPLIPGTAVFMEHGGRMSHVGVYVGKGKVIEARGADYGVVITELKSRLWTHWGLLNWLSYDIKAESKIIKAAKTSISVDAGDHSTPKKDDNKSFEKQMTYKEANHVVCTMFKFDEDYWAKRENIDPWESAKIIRIAQQLKNG